MCGIVGLLLRDPDLEAQLGSLVVPMVAALDERGPDSAGIATYCDDPAVRFRLCLRASEAGRPDWRAVAAALADGAGIGVALSPDSQPTGASATLLLDSDPFDVRALLGKVAPGGHVVGWGRSLEIVKDIGRPSAICARHGVADRRGHLAVAHTRMATESAVTADHSHPFVPAADLCMVHNGSFSNHASVRRRLEAQGIGFETDNDSEVAARYLAARLAAGDDLEQSVRGLMKDLDGFFTLVVTTGDELSVVRDAFACKPAVVAETEAYVAVASEYRALATLPGIEDAVVFEPQPEEVHTWRR
jgi:methylamine---glutamate N-methyltransferase subunit A